MTFIVGEQIEKEKDSSDSRKKRNAVLDKEFLWPNGIIPFEITSDFDGKLQQLARNSLKLLDSNTCYRL